MGLLRNYFSTNQSGKAVRCIALMQHVLGPVNLRLRQGQALRARLADRAMSLQALRLLDAEVPDFDHTNYDYKSLHGAVQEYMDFEIRPELLRTDSNCWLARRMRQTPIQAGLMYTHGKDYVTIALPAESTEAEWEDLYFHELWHLMRDHPLPYEPADGAKGEKAYWRPPRPVLPHGVPFDLEECRTNLSLHHALDQWCETDAEAAAAHLRAISALGKRIYHSEKLLLGL